MKETIGIFLLSWAMAAEVGGQVVFFDNDEAFNTPADRNVYFVDGTRVVGTDFVAQLYYGASADSLFASIGASSFLPQRSADRSSCRNMVRCNPDFNGVLGGRLCYSPSARVGRNGGGQLRRSCGA